ncbi:unnamed protein product [Cylicostephanus goldi]|uniref:Uncharacterized protein n=1 Tax=Cylicostephanus goldi TaxID=71465 RepID=A0A3P7MJT5_CYLGO|nr:unnamed protein product [Cylicostephanus goldi]
MLLQQRWCQSNVLIVMATNFAQVKYVNSTDAYEPNRTWTCDGRFPQIAFRACRKSCGYCDFSVIEYNLENALNSCKV